MFPDASFDTCALITPLLMVIGVILVLGPTVVGLVLWYSIRTSAKAAAEANAGDNPASSVYPYNMNWISQGPGIPGLSANM